ncbi:MAG: vanadium-dependent haloperoxidase [Bacteroidia bacterium]
MKLHWNPIILGMTLAMGMLGCTPEKQKSMTDQEIAIAWAEMTTYLMKYTPANSPTYASRTAGYIGLTMYESIVHGYPEYQSLAGQLNGLEDLPMPESGVEYSWPASMNAAQSAILQQVYNQTSDKNKQMIDSLESLIAKNITSRGIESDVIERSADFGRAISDAIFEWSKTDGGHRGYLHNFDKEFEHKVFPGSWKPPLYAQSFSHHPLHPYWGKNRTFLAENAEIPLPDMIPYDTTKGSPYYQQFLAVYEKEQTLTREEKETALWWGDDPSDTFTPPGHSYYLATLVIKKKQPELIVCAETYARVGMAVADAFINCWKWKYHFFSERPNTFVPQFIDQEWESFWPDPPFPAFPSGHAIQASAAATVLADLYGNEFTFIDSAHVGRPRDELRNTDFVERHFTNFWEIATETANSRFFGGIHTPQDNEVGLRKGARIAGNVNELNWKKERIN